MHLDETPSSDQPNTPAPPDEASAVEDASTPDREAEASVGEDEPGLLGPASRRFDAGAGDVAAPEEVASAAAETAPKSEDVDESIETLDEPDAPVEDFTVFDTVKESRKVAVELRRLESEVRKLLEERDPKRKRKLAGTRRWQELEEDVISWYFAGRFEESSLRRLRELIAKRNELFKRLEFLARTRHTWNT